MKDNNSNIVENVESIFLKTHTTTDNQGCKNEILDTDLKSPSLSKSSVDPIKIVISCGGSGGHIYPGLVLADAIREHLPLSEILFVGAKDKMEMKMVSDSGYKIEGLNISGFHRKSWLKNFSLIYKLMHSIIQSMLIIKRFKPHIAIGTGGYASASMLFTASILKIPTLIHEQNAVPGLANVILSKFVDKICVSYESAVNVFPPRKVVITGTPIRNSILKNNKEDSYNYFNFSPHKKCLLIFGGSLGTQSINDCILKDLNLIISQNIQIIWITGEKYYDQVYKSIPDYCVDSIRLYPFFKDIGKAYAVADVVISRGGAVAIAELCAVQKPVIFIPSPNITNDHQSKNIDLLLKEGAVICVKDKNLSFHLAKQAIWLLGNVVKQQTMMQKIKKWSYPNATQNVLKEILKMLPIPLRNV